MTPSAQPRTLLSLFDGTGSICKPFRKAGWLVRRLDIDGQHGADIVADILCWDPEKDWEGPLPDVIFAGPPCENYSVARTKANAERNLDLADRLVSKTAAVIDYFHKLNPRLQFFIENPDSSMLWKRWVSHRFFSSADNHYMALFAQEINQNRTKKSYDEIQKLKTSCFRTACKDRHAVRLDYCQYGAKYRKRTRIMTNNPFRGVLCNQTKCPNIVDGKHVEVAQRGPRFAQDESSHTLDQLHAYPEKLVKAVFQHVSKNTSTVRSSVGPDTPKPEILPFGQARRGSFVESEIQEKKGSSGKPEIDRVKRTDRKSDHTKQMCSQKPGIGRVKKTGHMADHTKTLCSQKPGIGRVKKGSTVGPMSGRVKTMRFPKPGLCRVKKKSNGDRGSGKLWNVHSPRPKTDGKKKSFPAPNNAKRTFH